MEHQVVTLIKELNDELPTIQELDRILKALKGTDRTPEIVDGLLDMRSALSALSPNQDDENEDPCDWDCEPD